MTRQEWMDKMDEVEVLTYLIAQCVNFAAEEVSKWEVQRYVKHAEKKNNT